MNAPTFSGDDNLSLMNEVLQGLFGSTDTGCRLSYSEKPGFRLAVPVLYLICIVFMATYKPMERKPLGRVTLR